MPTALEVALTSAKPETSELTFSREMGVSATNAMHLNTLYDVLKGTAGTKEDRAAILGIIAKVTCERGITVREFYNRLISRT